MFKRLAVGGLAAGLSLAVLAQANNPGQPIRHKVGDVAVFQVEQVSENRTLEETVTVTAVDGGLIRSTHVRPGRTPPALEGVLTEAHALAVSGAGGTRYEPPIPLVQWPLAVGQSWKAAYDMQMPNQARSRGQVDMKVVAAEKLSTPAGEFDTYKIEQAGWINGVSWNGSVRVAQAMWFAPAIGRMVRTEFRSFRDGRPWEHTVTQLKSFQAAP